MKLDHLSWTQLSCLSRCGEQYRRRYGLKEKTPPGIALIRGRSTHKAQEKNLIHKLEEGELLSRDQVRQIASDEFDEAATGEYVIDGLYSGLSVSEALGRGKDEAVSLAGLHSDVVAPLIEPAAVEVRIEIPQSEQMPCTFVSILDLVEQGDVIVDTKTASKSPGKSDADLSDQLTGQCLAFYARHGKPSPTQRFDFLVRTPTGKLKHVPLETTRSRDDLAVFVRRVQAAHKMIEAEVFIPTSQDNWACSPRWCGYASTCRYYRGQPRPTS